MRHLTQQPPKENPPLGQLAPQRKTSRKRPQAKRAVAKVDLKPRKDPSPRSSAPQELTGVNGILRVLRLQKVPRLKDQGKRIASYCNCLVYSSFNKYEFLVLSGET